VRDRSLEKLSVEDFHFLVDVNLNGAFHMIHATLPLMRANAGGLILNISSVAGVRASVLGGAGYSASKFGLTALSHAIGNIRHALGDQPDKPTFIQTLPRRGYRLLVTPVPVANDLSSTMFDPEENIPGGDLGWFQNLKRRGVIEAAVAYAVVGWLLIQVADIVFDQLHVPDWAGTFVTVLVILGFPIVLLVSWFFEFRDGRAVLDELSPADARKRRFSRTYFSVIAALGLASIAVFLYDWNYGLPIGADTLPESSIGELPPIRENSFAVLPFFNVDESEQTQIFANGLVDDVITRLSTVPGLRVSSRGDSFTLEPNTPSRKVRERLRVEKYLEGSVASSGDKIRVIVQLIDTATGFHLLSRTFDRNSEDIFNIRDEITSLTVANVRAALPPEARVSSLKTEDHPTLDTYVLYRRGVDTSRLPTTIETIHAALDWFDQALAVDPGYAAAYAGKCTVYLSGYFTLRESAYIDLAQQSCGAALELNPNLPVVHAALGELYAATGRNADAETSYQRALAVDPSNVAALTGLGDVYLSQNRVADAEAVLTRATDVHPGDATAYRSLGNFYYYTGRFDMAADQYAYAVGLEPDDMDGYSNLGAARMMTGDFKGSLDAYEKAIDIAPTQVAYSNLGLMHFYLGELDAAIRDHKKAVELGDKSHLNWSNLGDALWVAGRTDEARQAYETAEGLASDALRVNPQDSATMTDLAWIEATLGRKDKAGALMEKARAAAPDDPYTWYYDALVKLRAGDTAGAMDALEKAASTGYPLKLMAADPLLEQIRDTPRFVAILNAE
ncbi:MAG TPA: SDR family NAD(P)-dependent oxidoreductase, partial [Woeseiaceae bacterium]|nr:SDR family NAD(P)-dependent oxidoreductase [Woeseiaceae bacterium]